LLRRDGTRQSATNLPQNQSAQGGCAVNLRSHQASIRILTAVLGLSLSAMFATSGKALDLKPKTFPLTVLGVPIDVPVSISFDAKTSGDGMDLQARAQGNLKAVQDNALTIARAIPMPRDNCARTGINPVVNSIDSASISPAGNSAVVTIDGQVTAWGCAHPFNTTVKTIVATDSVHLSTSVVAAVFNQTQVGLRLAGPVTVTTGHALTTEVANLLAGDIEASLTAQLTTALNASAARATLPDLPGLDANIQNVEFASDGPVLLVSANGTARMSGDAFNKILQLMNK
jgi:hypothetical protein